MDQPSRLDNDYYAFTMGQLIYERYHDVRVEYAFRNRTFAVALARRITAEKLRERIEAYRALRFTHDELDWLAAQGVFSTRYLTWLGDAHALPPVELGEVDGHLTLTYTGPWADAVFWETPLLAIVSELYYERFATNVTEGEERLAEKRRYLESNPHLAFVEFGTRRRHSRGWQAHVVESLRGLPNLRGTSNVALARRFSLAPSGTIAHQLTIVTGALRFEALVDAHVEVAQAWRDLYGSRPELMTWLPDTYSTAFGLGALDDELLGAFAGVRQDSGDPFVVGETILERWRDAGIAPTDKVLVFSDALDLRTMSLLHERFGDRTTVLFGWGTNLTNDLGYEPLSLVIKPNAVVLDDGRRLPCVKLSDNIAKATGPVDAIARYRAATRY